MFLVLLQLQLVDGNMTLVFHVSPLNVNLTLSISQQCTYNLTFTAILKVIAKLQADWTINININISSKYSDIIL